MANGFGQKTGGSGRFQTGKLYKRFNCKDIIAEALKEYLRKNSGKRDVCQIGDEDIAKFHIGGQNTVWGIR